MNTEEFNDGWASDACTLPTAERPLRVAEFDGLFAAALRGLERVEPTRLRLVLDASVEATARELAGREAGCCSFFDFTFAPVVSGRLLMEVSVPAAQVAVLDALAGRASAAGFPR